MIQQKIFLFKTASLVAVLAVVSTSAQAATVNLTGLDINLQFNANGGNFTDVTAPLGATSATHEFVVTDLDIAGDSTANDTVTFTYDVTATGGVVDLVSGTLFAYGVNGAADPTDNEIDPGEALTFDNLSASVVFGDPTTDVLQIDSATFTGFTWRFIGGDVGETIDVAIDGGLFTQPNGGGGVASTFDTPTSAFTVGGAPSGNGFGIDTIAATFELSAVPEPSSLALLVLGGLAMVRHRHL
ncbi:MAG: PEP-CTERM sorting domain-containing protein [Planctomycetota bacterium]